MDKEEEKRVIERMDATILFFDHLQWYWRLPYHYKLIWRYVNVRHSTKGETVALRRYFHRTGDHNNGKGSTIHRDEYRRGQVLDDMREYHYRCECLADLPMAFPSCVLMRIDL